MIARLLDGRFVALHLDTRTRARDVWVSAGTLWPALSRWTAIRHCLDDVATELTTVARHARRVHGLVNRRECSIREHRQRLDRAERMADALERVERNVARLLDAPTSLDHVELFLDYETVDPQEPSTLDAMWPAAGGLNTDVEMLAHRARSVQRLVDIRGRDLTANESLRLHTQAHDVVDMLERVRIKLATLRKHKSRPPRTDHVSK